MIKKLQLVTSLCLFAISFNGFSQRYLTETFSSVSVTSNVIYGVNVSVITGAPAADSLKMDVYQPVNDSIAARPLVLVFHTGSFLPRVANGQPTGSKKDSAIVEMCTQFAKRGYVAVAPDYRLGWNPVSSSVDVRTGTLLNAVYRSIQDAKNCVRYFKSDKANLNIYKIDTSKIAVGGLGSGGYIALAYASLTQDSEINISKFLDNSQTPPVPYVNQAISGNVDGTNSTGSLNIGNFSNHTSTINMAFNIGGAVGDSSWIQAGEVPIVGMHCTKDQNAPYKTGAVIVPTTGDFVVEASGSYDVLRIVNKAAINNNQIFKSSLFNDVYTTRANSLNDGYEGLFPIVTPAPGANMSCTGLNANPQTEQGSPWDWWSEATFIAQYNGYSGTTNGSVANCLQLTSNPGQSGTKGRLYIDTIQGYLNPRIVCALGLAGCVPNPAGINEKAAVSDITIFPNPSSTEINFSAKGSNTIKSVELYDVTGRMVKQIVGLNTQTYTIQREGLSTGLYITKIQLNKGSISKKIILE